MDLAVDIAKETVLACRVDGYNVSKDRACAKAAPTKPEERLEFID